MKKVIVFVFLATISLRAAAQYQAPTTTRRDGSDITVGTLFSLPESRIATAITVYRFSEWASATSVGLWDARTRELISSGSVGSGPTGWVTVPIDTVILDSGSYVVGYSNQNGWYSFTPDYFPRVFPGYSALSGRFVYQGASFPDQVYGTSSYSVFPVLQDSVDIALHPALRDTIIIPARVVDTLIMFVRVVDTVRIVDTVRVELPPDTVFFWPECPKADSSFVRHPDGDPWFYELNTGERRYRFVRSVIWRRQTWDGSAWKPDE